MCYSPNALLRFRAICNMVVNLIVFVHVFVKLNLIPIRRLGTRFRVEPIIPSLHVCCVYGIALYRCVFAEACLLKSCPPNYDLSIMCVWLLVVGWLVGWLVGCLL
jgi:hypothetical protein